MKSTPSQADRIAWSSVISASRKSKRSTMPVRLAMRPSERLSIPRTWSPQAISVWAIFDPMKPATPVIRYLAMVRRIANLSLLPLPSPSQNAAHLLGRNRKALGNTSDFLIFFFPDLGDYNFGKLLGKLLERLFTGNALRPG